MSEDGRSPLTEVNSGSSNRDAAAGPLTLLLFPVIVSGLSTVVVAVVAAIAGWQRELMLLIAAAAGATILVPAIVLLHRLRRERRAVVRELEGAKARVGGLVESAMDAIITIDSAQNVVHFNAAAQKVFLWPRGAVIGQPLHRLIPERFRAAHHAHVEHFGATAVTARGMGTQTVLHGLRSDGSEFPIEASISQHEDRGRKLYTVILRDITRRVEAERRVLDSEARMRGILDSAMDAIITVDGDQRIVLFNRAAEAVFECPRDQAVGAALDGFIPERFRAGHRGLVAGFGESGAASRRMGQARVVMGLRRGGDEFPLEASISSNTEGGQPFYTVILRDVSERVRAEAALERSREEIHGLAMAASVAREQEKSRIARELHDELGQSLTALKMDVTWLREQDPGARHAAKLDAMRALLDATMAATRRISADLRPLMLDDLGLVAACEWLAQNFTRHTGVACELAFGDAALDLPDPHATAVFRVLQESLTNAAKHARATQVEATLERSGNEIVLSVSDNGCGFDPSLPAARASYGHIGLRERAHLLGGSLRIESATGKGTMVELRIPAPTGPA